MSGHTLQWRFAPVLWLTICPRLQSLRFGSGGYLSPANDHDAGSTFGTGALSTHWILALCWCGATHDDLMTAKIRYVSLCVAL